MCRLQPWCWRWWTVGDCQRLGWVSGAGHQVLHAEQFLRLNLTKRQQTQAIWRFYQGVRQGQTLGKAVNQALFGTVFQAQLIGHHVHRVSLNQNHVSTCFMQQQRQVQGDAGSAAAACG